MAERLAVGCAALAFGLACAVAFQLGVALAAVAGAVAAGGVAFALASRRAWRVALTLALAPLPFVALQLHAAAVPEAEALERALAIERRADVALHQRGDPAEAARLYAEAARARPSFYVLHKLGVARFLSGAADGAALAFDAARRAPDAPPDPDGRYARGLAWLAEGRDGLALAALEAFAADHAPFDGLR